MNVELSIYCESKEPLYFTLSFIYDYVLSNSMGIFWLLLSLKGDILAGLKF